MEQEGWLHFLLPHFGTTSPVRSCELVSARFACKEYCFKTARLLVELHHPGQGPGH